MPSSAPHVLLRGGAIYSQAHPAATAMVTVGDSVAWVGDEDGAAAYVDEVDSVLHLEGRLVTPGFVDAHVHLGKTGLALQTVDLGGAASLVEALGMLDDRCAGAAPGPLFAHGWDETRWSEGRPFTGSELERAVSGRVAYVSRVDAHSAVVTAALVEHNPSMRRMTGWRGDGLVERDAHHAARTVVDGLRNVTERRDALLLALRTAASRGITSVHEANAPHIAPYDDIELVRSLQAEHVLPEVVAYWGALRGGDHAAAEVHGFAGDLCADGALGSRTAALYSPYADSAESSGHLYLEAAEVRDHVTWCTRRGVQAGFHVIGDRALAEVADGLRQAAAEVGHKQLVAARHRLEHVEMPSPAVVALLAELGVVASVQPAFDAAWGGSGELYEQRLGAARAATMNPLSSMVRAGVVLAFGSDSPVTPLDPWGAVRAAACHHSPTERLPVATAFDAHTRGGHRARRDDTAGTLEAGSPATYAVWDVGADAAAIRPGALPDVTSSGLLPQCVRTIICGSVAFDAADPDRAYGPLGDHT